MIPDMITLALFNPQAILDSFFTATPMTIYLMVLGLMIVESSFIPFPSEVIVPPAAYLAATSHEVNIVVVVILATLGALIGALVNYGLSLWIGRPIVYRFADSRFGHACLINREKVEHAERYFDNHGAVSTFIGRLVSAVRQLISIPAGLSRMNIFKFMLYTSLGAGVWNIVLAILGWWLGQIVTRDALFEKVEQYNTYLTWAGIGLGLACVAIIAYNALKPQKANEND